MTSGILLIDKPLGKTSFFLVHALRKITGIQKIGHAGTLDPLATGVMVMLIGKNATKISSSLIGHDKTYDMTILLGKRTNTYDLEGEVTEESPYVPSIEEIEKAILKFQGTTEQIPPMFSAKKVGGKKLYDLARKGQTIERKPIKVTMHIELLSYSYPNLTVRVDCSSGTYMRSLADDLGEALGSYGTIAVLRRLKSGPFSIDECSNLDSIEKAHLPLRSVDEVLSHLVLSS